MDTLIIQRIQDAISKVIKRGYKPTMIWLGQEEKYELERLVKETETLEISPNIQKRNEIFGLPYSFVSSPKWLTISYEEE